MRGRRQLNVVPVEANEEVSMWGPGRIPKSQKSKHPKGGGTTSSFDNNSSYDEDKLVDGEDFDENEPSGVGSEPPVNEGIGASPVGGNPPVDTGPQSLIVGVGFVVAAPIALQNTAFSDDLGKSVDLLAQDMLAERGGNYSLSIASELSVDAFLPTICPDFVSSEERCEDVSIFIPLIPNVELGSHTNEEANGFKDAFQDSIANQRLQEVLDAVNPSTPVWIVTGSTQRPIPASGIQGASATTTQTTTEQQPSAFGGEAGGKGPVFAVLGVGFVLLSALLALVVMRRRHEPAEKLVPVSSNPKLGVEGAEESPRHWDLHMLSDIDEERPSSCSSLSATSSKSADFAPIEKDTGFLGRIGSSSSLHLGMNMGPWNHAHNDSVQNANPASSEKNPNQGVGHSKDSIEGHHASTIPSKLLPGFLPFGRTIGGPFPPLSSFDSYESSSVSSNLSDLALRSILDPGRAAEFDRLMSKGDWEAVAQTADRYGEEERKRERILLSTEREEAKAVVVHNGENDPLHL